MNFLNACNVRLEKHYNERVVKCSLHTDDEMFQNVIINMVKDEKLEKFAMTVRFDKTRISPKKLSISANQYTMNPFLIEIKLIKIGQKEPYHITQMKGLATMLDLEPDTGRIVFSFYRNDNEGKFSEIKFIANHIAY